MVEAIQWLNDKTKIIGRVQFVIMEKTSKTISFSFTRFFLLNPIIK